MRFAITACDRYLCVFDELLNAGWTPVKLFTFPELNAHSSNKAVIKLAQSRKIPIQLSRMTDHDLLDLKKNDCDILILASYNWRIPEWRGYVKYAANFHPSPLPVGRGPYPLVNAILASRISWAVSCHQVENEFDAGAVLANEEFEIGARETHESISLKIQLAARRLTSQVAKDFENLWRNAQVQEFEDYWPLFSDSDRTLNFSKSSCELDTQLRAFGLLECLALVNGKKISVKSAFTWKEAHDATVGAIVHAQDKTVVVACSDGYVAMTDWYTVAS